MSEVLAWWLSTGNEVEVEGWGLLDEGVEFIFRDGALDVDTLDKPVDIDTPPGMLAGDTLNTLSSSIMG